VPRERAGARARCQSCGTVQWIPEPDLLSGQVSTFDLAPASVLPTDQSPPRDQTPRFPDRRPSQAWSEAIRPWVFDSSQVQGIGILLLFFSVADLLMTFILLSISPAFFESNPLAQWFFARWNMTGMVIFKFGLIGGVIAVAEFIERRRPGWGRFVLLVGCVGAAYAFLTGLRMYLRLLS
jgi:hypothetical protein